MQYSVFLCVMKIYFSKYQGTGNDFIILDNTNNVYNQLSIKQIAFLCDRKLGIGADGLIKISIRIGFDFEVEYYNADGSQSFCGNGARCSVAFANKLGLIADKTEFYAIDGAHKASIENNKVRLEMLPVASFEKVGNDFFLDTGSPHYVHFSEGDSIDVVDFGRSIRYSKKYAKDGVNVNLVETNGTDCIKVETYERGVEDETLSCGTGVTASALIYMFDNQSINLKKVNVKTKGGELVVESDRYSVANGFKNIWLTGETKHVFDGSIAI